MDAALFGPGDRVIYQKQRKQYDSVEFTTKESGEYYFCFSNEFSSFSHKVIYFDFATGNEPPITEEIGKTHKAFTQLEVSVMKIHEALTLVRDYQTHHRSGIISKGQGIPFTGSEDFSGGLLQPHQIILIILVGQV